MNTETIKRMVDACMIQLIAARRVCDIPEG